MRRKRLGILCIVLLLLPVLLRSQEGTLSSAEPAGAAGEGQPESRCRKRILVFLDVSGSMYPLKRDSSSPFWRSIDSLEGLLNEPGFIEAEDVVEVVRFGKSVNVPKKAKGSVEMRGLLQELRTNRESDLDTDFRLFFDALAKAMEEASFYDSQVILLGSDLVHEKNRTATAFENVNDWTALLAEKAEALEKIRSNSGNTSTVIFLAPYRAGHKDVQDRVLADLGEGGVLPRVQPVMSGTSPQALADDLIYGLTLKLKPALSRDREDSNLLSFIIRNPNCRDLRLESMSLKTGTGAEERTKTITLRPGEDSVEGEGTRVIREPVPTGPGWEDLSALTLTVKPEKGPQSSVTGTAGSWLKFKPVRAVVEGYLPKPVLRLDLSVLGHTLDARTYELTVRADGQGADDPPLAQRSFSSPGDLDPQEAQLKRIVLPVSREVYDQIRRNATFRVAIAEAELLEEKNDTVRIIRDSVADRLNAYLALAGLAGLLGVGYSWLNFSSIVKAFPALQKIRTPAPWWIGMLALGFLPLLLNGIHLLLLRFLPPAGVDWLALLLSLVVLPVALILSVRKMMSVRFTRKVLSANPPLEPEQYRRSSFVGSAVPWLVGLGVPLAFFVAWMIGRSGTSPDFARDVDLPQLEVVSRSK